MNPDRTTSQRPTAEDLGVVGWVYTAKEHIGTSSYSSGGPTSHRAVRATSAGDSGTPGEANFRSVEPSPSRYPADIRHGPMTSGVIAQCLATLGSGGQRQDVFMKVGSDETVSANFLACFAQYALPAALEPTRAWFTQTLVDGTATSFDRRSLAAGVGWTAARVVEGSPSPLAKETGAIHPGFAVVLLGTVDTVAGGVHAFERNLRRMIDANVAAGTVPVLTTIPPRLDSAAADALVPEMNAVIRALAQAWQVPYVDLWQLLVPLPTRGLTSDGVHLNVYRTGLQPRPCRLSADGLAFGMNQRNLLTLEALDRVRRFVLVGEVPEAEPPTLAGSGTWDDPRLVDRLPFVDYGDTRTSVSVVGRYGSFPQDEGGPEIVYRIELSAPTKIRARVFVDDGVDVDLHWLDSPDAARTVARADKTLDVMAPAGRFYLSADTFVAAGQPKPGPYRLTVVALP